MTRWIAVAASFVLACGAAQAQAPAQKGKSAEKKKEAPARGGYDTKKSAGAKKAAQGAVKSPQGMDPQGTEAQGLAK